LNEYNAIGRVGQDASTRFPTSEKAVTSWSLAVDSGWGDNKVTTWFRCNAWGDRYAKLSEYIKKGNQLGVTGEISQREYEVNGEKRQSLEINIRDVTLISSQNSDNRGKSENGFRANAEPEQDGFAEDDIPF